MMKLLTLMVPAALALVSFPAVGAVQEPSPAALVMKNSMPISFANGVLGGSGADFLARETANSQFVLLGEDHYVRQVPIFAGALFRMLRDRHGFHHLVVEQDRVAVQDAITAPYRGRADKLGKLAARYPNLFEFASDQDLELLAEVGRLERGKDAICGVEQALGPVRYFDELMKSAPTSYIRAEVGLLRALAQKLDPQPKYTVNFFLDPSVEDRLETLRADFAAKPGSRIDEMLLGLRKSAEIFGYYRRAEAGEPVGLYNNTVREAWFKRLLMHCYRSWRRSEPMPKALFKFGANHMYRGINSTTSFAVGNLAHEFAIANGMEGYGIMVVTLAPGKKYDSIPEWLRPLLPASLPEQPVLVDLRPLRPFQRSIRMQGKVEDTEAYRRVLHGYDALIIMPNSVEADMKLSGLTPPG